MSGLAVFAKYDSRTTRFFVSMKLKGGKTILVAEHLAHQNSRTLFEVSTSANSQQINLPYCCGQLAVAGGEYYVVNESWWNCTGSNRV
jgi:hypothetical protein